MDREFEFNTIGEISEKAILVSVDTGEFDAIKSMEELRELAFSAGAQVVATVIQKRNSADVATCVGEGKLLEVKNIIGFENADIVIFDTELSGSQLKNIEKVLNVKVIDRTMLILDIFALRARTSEGRLQVELAQQKYLLPRLQGMGNSLSRQGGGIGTRGPGESMLETDRRHIREKIAAISERLKAAEKNRELLKKKRRKDEVLTVAILGYTNVGKSTILNYLTNAGVLCEDMLFATLDPTARSLKLPDGRNVMLVDTVGLVSRLPHMLVEAFHSTLQEAVDADLILNVCDISSPDANIQLTLTEELLKDLHAEEVPVLNILNKCDKLSFDDNLISFKNNCIVSAKTGFGIDNMLKKISEMLKPTHTRIKLLVPFEQGALVGEIRKNGKVFSEEYTGEGTALDILCDNRLLYKCREYILTE